MLIIAIIDIILLSHEGFYSFSVGLSWGERSLPLLERNVIMCFPHQQKHISNKKRKAGWML